MWSDEQINDAVQMLWNASEKTDIQKVNSTDDKERKESYLVVNAVTYTDHVYVKALEKLVGDGKLIKDSEEDDRLTFRRASEKVATR